MSDLDYGGEVTGSRGGWGDARGVDAYGNPGYYDSNNNFHPDPPENSSPSIEWNSGPSYFDEAVQRGIETFHAEAEKEKAKHLTLGQSASSLAGGIAIGTVAATFDPKDPVGSMAKSGRNILCVFGIIALYAVAGLLLLMASGALDGRHYVAFGILLIPIFFCVVGGIGLIRKMMNKPFLPSASSFSTSQKDYAEAAVRMQQVHGDKSAGRPVFLILLGIICVLIVALFIVFALFSR